MFKRLFLSILSLVLGTSAVFSLPTTTISKEAYLKGTLKCGNVIVDGVLEGTILVDEKADITEDGVVKGRMEAMDADISGRVDGDVLAVEDVFITPTGVVTGNIQCRYLIVEKGALANVKTSMGEIKEIGKGEKKVVRKKATTRRRRRRRRRR